MEFTRAALEVAGFAGWVPVTAIRTSACPSTGGVYAIARASADPVLFAERSCGGGFKGRNPTVSRETLAANWVDGAEILYIGKADRLRRRLTQLADFGAGKAAGHWGGRLIWQLGDAGELLIAWKETPGRVPAEVRAELIAAFRESHSKPPFANAPHRFGG